MSASDCPFDIIRPENNDKDNVDGAKFQQVMYQNGDFPYTLYHLLMNAVSMKYSDIVSFPPDGRAFIVYENAKFEDMVIPKFFSHRSIKSFMTQMYLYGFNPTLLTVDSRA